jgi:hypothetical protein
MHACKLLCRQLCIGSHTSIIPQSLLRSLQKTVADQHTLLATMVPSNKIIKLDEFSMKDDLSHVQVVEAPVPELKQGEVLVNAYLRPVNPTDVILIKTGWGGLVPLPSTPGSEGVGKVVKNGPGASKFKEGQRVAAAPWPQFQGRGSWAQYVAIPEKDLVSNRSMLQLCAGHLWHQHAGGHHTPLIVTFCCRSLSQRA